MTEVMSRVTGLIAGVALAGGSVLASASPALADQSAASASVATNSLRQAMACYLYVGGVGYYNVRTTKSPTATLIIKYTGTRLPVWDACGSEAGASYRCAIGEPSENYWVAVNYKGRKGYVAEACAGGLGA
ncbi:hypothetical protein [Micromonospora rubida]